MSLRFTYRQTLGALLVCATLSGCLKKDAFYPVVAPAPMVDTDYYIVPVTAQAISENVLADAAPKPKQETQPVDAPVPQPPEDVTQGQMQTPPPVVSPATQISPSVPAIRFGGFHSYFINREVRSDNIKMFPRWTGMLARYNAESHTLDQICGAEQYSTCKLKEWKEFLDGLRGRPLSEQLDAINRFLNKYPYIDDIVNWGFDNYWETPYEFQRKSGNCKDYAIAKFMSLRALGVPNDIMRVEVVRDLNLGGVIHAVLVVNGDDKVYMLDNQIKQVVLTTRIYHYVPIYSINEQHWWRHYPAE